MTRHMSEEVKQKISAKLKGRKLSPETKKKLSETRIRRGIGKGIPLSEEHKHAISVSTKGKKQGPLSDEHRAKLSKAKKGKPGVRKGIPNSPETRAKLSAALKGRKLSEEHVAKMIVARTGKKLSLETKQKISAAHKGKKKTPEQIAAMSAARKGVPTGRKGVPLSEEHKQALREGSARRWAKPEEHEKSSKASKIYYQSDKGMATSKAVAKLRKGKPAANKGVPQSDATKQKISQSLKTYYNTAEGKLAAEERSKNYKGKPAYNKGKPGKPLSEEHKAAISARLFENPPFKGKKHTPEAIARMVAKNKGRTQSVDERQKKSNAMRQYILNNPGKLEGNNNYKSGWYESSKSGNVYCRSSYEFKFCELLDDCDAVESYELESLHIKYEYDGIIRNYIPDFLIFLCNGDYRVVEIKNEHTLIDSITTAKHKAAADALGTKFCVYSEKQLFSNDFRLIYDT